MSIHVKSVVFMCLAIVGSLLLVGCGGGADENKPMSEVQTEAKQMDVDALRDKAMAYKKAIEAKMVDVQAIKTKLKDIPLTEMLGDQAKELKQEVDSVSQSLKALKDRFEVYFDRIKELKGDLSGLES